MAFWGLYLSCFKSNFLLFAIDVFGMFGSVISLGRLAFLITLNIPSILSSLSLPFVFLGTTPFDVVLWVLDIVFSFYFLFFFPFGLENSQWYVFRFELFSWVCWLFGFFAGGFHCSSDLTTLVCQLLFHYPPLYFKHRYYEFLEAAMNNSNICILFKSFPVYLHFLCHAL